MRDGGVEIASRANAGSSGCKQNLRPFVELFRDAESGNLAARRIKSSFQNLAQGSSSRHLANLHAVGPRTTRQEDCWDAVLLDRSMAVIA
jgi:hypothetical protein